MEKTIISLLENAKFKMPSKPYLADKKDNGWEKYNFIKTHEESYNIASGLHTYGINLHDNIAIIAEARARWILFELGIICAGGISVPLSIKLRPEEIPFRIIHSESKIIAVSRLTISNVMSVYNDFGNHNIKIVYLDDDKNYALSVFDKFGIDTKDRLIMYNDLISLGSNNFEKNIKEIQEKQEKINENSTATICYTSGTTGNPKGIMLTHLNYWSNCQDSIKMFKVPEDFKTLLILPCDHSFAHTVGIYSGLLRGNQLYFVDFRKGAISALKKIPKLMIEANSDFLLTVPALSGNFMNKIISGIEKKGKLIKGLFNLGLRCGINYYGNGYKKPFILKRLLCYLPYKLIDKIIFKQVRQIFGKDMKFCVGGGALLDIKQQEFFYTIGVPIYQGYGLTEAAPVISSNTPFKHKLGSSGIIAPTVKCKIIKENGTEANIGEKGQIVIQGNNVMKGYFKNPEATKKTIKNGWLYTGDLGYMDKDNFLVVVGRQKALLISEDGEKYSPEEIEEAIVNCSKYISQTMIYNDHKKYTTALITLNETEIQKLIRNSKINSEEKLLKIIEKDFNQFKSSPEFKNRFPKKWLPSSFIIIEEQFSEDNHMINSTMKMVRYKITEFYQDKLDYMYTHEGKPVNNDLNIDILNKMFYRN